MIISYVLEKPTSTDLVTIDFVKKFLGESGQANVDEVVLLELIRSVSSQMESYCNRLFGEHLVSDYWVNASFPYWFHDGPVTRLVKAEIDGENVLGQETLFADQIVSYESRENYMQEYRVHYIAGYSLPGSEPLSGQAQVYSPPLPDDLRYCCYELVKDFYLARGRSADTTSEDISGVVSASFNSFGGIPRIASQILNPYRQINV